MPEPRAEVDVRRVRAYIGLGSNVGRSATTLAQAVGALAALPGASLRGVSRLYQTRPVGVLDQPDFLNAVVALDLQLSAAPERGALELLARLKALEAAFGRRPGRRWGPRPLDLDLLLFGRASFAIEHPAGLADVATPPASTPGRPPEPRLLDVPHRDVADRLFVLSPLSDLAPGLVPPGWHETVATARRRREAIEGLGAARAIASWDPRRGAWVR